MEEFPGNSRERKTGKGGPDKKEKVEPVVRGEVVRRKKPLGRRFAETFVQGDARSVWGYVMFDVLLPAAKDAMADAMSQGVEKMLFGEARSASRRTGRHGAREHISYDRFAKDRDRPLDRRDVSRERHSRRARHDFGEFVLKTRVEAEEVIDRLYDLISKYEAVTVADLYDLVGETSDATDVEWGWTELRGSGIQRVRDGYLLNLPRPEPLD